METKIISNLNPDAELQLLSACRMVIYLRDIAHRIEEDTARCLISDADLERAAELRLEAAFIEQSVFCVLQSLNAGETARQHCLELMANNFN